MTYDAEIGVLDRRVFGDSRRGPAPRRPDRCWRSPSAPASTCRTTPPGVQQASLIDALRSGPYGQHDVHEFADRAPEVLVRELVAHLPALVGALRGRSHAGRRDGLKRSAWSAQCFGEPRGKPGQSSRAIGMRHRVGSARARPSRARVVSRVSQVSMGRAIPPSLNTGTGQERARSVAQPTRSIARTAASTLSPLSAQAKASVSQSTSLMNRG